MTRSIIIYAALLGAAVFVLQWMEYQYWVRALSNEIYIVLIGIAFLAFGLWLGRALTPRAATTVFEKNQAALKSLGITDREYAVLEQLADGLSNKEIAAALHVSPNTIKTHIARLYEKLDVGQRMQAVKKARDLQLIQ